MSIVKTNKFQTLDGSTYSVPVQVVRTTLGSNLGTTDTATSDLTNENVSWAFTTTTTTWTDTSNLQLTITPKFSNSIIRLDLSIATGITSTSNGAPGLRIRRGTKIVFRPTLTYPQGPIGNGYFAGPSSVSMFFQNSFIAYDEPNTTSPVTYTIQYRSLQSGQTSVFFGYPGLTYYSPCNFLVATEFAQ